MSDIFMKPTGEYHGTIPVVEPYVKKQHADALADALDYCISQMKPATDNYNIAKQNECFKAIAAYRAVGGGK